MKVELTMLFMKRKNRKPLKKKQLLKENRFVSIAQTHNLYMLIRYVSWDDVGRKEASIMTERGKIVRSIGRNYSYNC